LLFDGPPVFVATRVKDYLKIQILTIEGLLNKTERVDAPTKVIANDFK
jgi:hypothetical protein